MDWFSNLPMNVQQMLAPFLQAAQGYGSDLADRAMHGPSIFTKPIPLPGADVAGTAPSSPAAAALAGAATGGPPAGGVASPASARPQDVQLTPMTAQGSLAAIPSPFGASRFGYGGVPNAQPGRVSPSFMF